MTAVNSSRPSLRRGVSLSGALNVPRVDPSVGESHRREPSPEHFRDRARAELLAARARLERLVDGVPEAALVRQHSPLMSPIVWDLVHIANYEEQWLLRALGEPPLTDAAFDRLYDAFKHPRATRAELPLLPVEEARRYLSAVRERVLELLERLPLSGDALREKAFVFGMVAQHEQQHLETVLATLALMTDFPSGLTPRRTWVSPRVDAHVDAHEEVLIPAGEAHLGTDLPWALDNERSPHRVSIRGFLLEKYPVTNARYLEFIEAGGYRDPRWWSPGGFEFIQRENLQSPLFWSCVEGTWLRRRFDQLAPIDPLEPVQHVSAHEADAFARWSGKRLPSEAEWEYAARGGTDRLWPWGEALPQAEHANLSGESLGPAPIATFPAGASAQGVMGLIGDVWEWTASSFAPWPGFRAFPYREYSEVFFGGEYRVLRGGSWATDAVACRTTFRNWDFPIRRHIFAGFRLARSV